MSKIEYKELIAFHPGYYINDIIDEMGITQNEFATRLGTTNKTLSKLLSAEIPLSKDMSQKLSQMLGTTVDVWLKLQMTYDEKVIEIEQRKSIDEEKEHLKLIDYNYFVELNSVKRTRNPEERICSLRKFLKVASLNILKKKDFLVACRSVVADVTERNIINSNAWVQTALNLAEKIKCNPYNKKLLVSYLPEIREMTLQEPDVFYPRLCEIFKECGVAFVLLPHLSNSGVHGAVKWINKEKVLLALNDRRLYADTFWFSLFHEIKHVLQEKLKATFISGNADYRGDECLEAEADSFSKDYLIPKDLYSVFLAKNRNMFNESSINDFAKQIKIHPGVVVGRLQYETHILYTQFHDLRIKYIIK